MDVIVTEIEQIAVVELPGEKLDAGNAKECKDVLHPIVDQHSRIVLDLSQLEFVDSSGLGVLLSCLRRQTGAEGSLLLCGLARPVRALFELVRMHRVFDIYNTREEAVGALKSGT